MSSLKKSAAKFCSMAAMFFLASAAWAQSAPGVALGTVKSISGSAIVLATDAGDTINVTVQDNARLLRVPPDAKDLKSASPLNLTDVQVGDRIRVRGVASADNKSIAAVSVIAMKKEDVTQKQQKDLQDWQRRGAGGLVKSVDAATNTVVISLAGIGTTKEIPVKVTPSTKVRRYSEESVKFDDAKPSSLTEVKVGDQLRARGNKNADGTELDAEEVVYGSFRNVAGLITAVDPAKNTITVNDLATKKPITVRIAPDSQMHKLPQMAAAMIAMRLKGIPLPGAAGAAGTPATGGGAQRATEGQGRGNGAPGGGQGGQRPGGGGGAADLNQILSRMPPVQFADLQKGEAVMIVTTEGTASADATAINLISGVEPILTASPAGAGAASLLTPWNLGTNAPDAGGGPQ